MECSRNYWQCGVTGMTVAKGQIGKKREGTGPEDKPQVTRDFVSLTEELNVYLKALGNH